MVESMEQFNEEEMELESAAPEEEFGAIEAASSETDRNQGGAAPHSIQSSAERMAIIEALIFVSDEPLSAGTIAEVLKEDSEAGEAAMAEGAQEFNSGN